MTTNAPTHVPRLVLAALALLAAALPAAALAQGDATLRVRARAGADIETMDPAHYLGNEENNVDLALNCKLVTFEPGAFGTTLDAARSLEVSDDGLRIDFALREGIEFHRGYGELTAEDVKFSFERIADPETASPYAQEWGSLDRVEVTGRYSGTIHLTEPYAPLFVSTLPWNAGSLVSEAAFEDLGAGFATNPVGCGPYAWSEWQPNQRLVLERFDAYFGEAPDFARIEILPLVEHQVAELAFERGELHETSIALDSLERFEAMDGVGIEVLPTLRYHWLGFDTSEAPFDDVRVREAVRYAIDVDEIIAGAYAGVPERANAMLPEGILGHWEDAPAYEPDLERARELLAEAGYPDGFETVITTDAVQEHQFGALIAQQQLARIGIRTEMNIVQELYASIGEASVPGLHVASYSGVLDPGYWFAWFTCDQVGQWNYWKWCDEGYDELHARAAVVVDEAERAELYVEMQRLIDEDVTAVWFTNGAQVHAYREDAVEPAFMTMYRVYPAYRDLSAAGE